MTVLKTSIIFEKKWLATQIDAAAACPSLEGNENVWRPRSCLVCLPWDFGVLATRKEFAVNLYIAGVCCIPVCFRLDMFRSDHSEVDPGSVETASYDGT